MTVSYTILLAPNPSMFTGPGTNTILLTTSTAGVIVIDPADENPSHLDAIVRFGNEHGGLRRILVTHGHPDHLGGAAALRERVGIPIYAFNRAGVSVLDEELADNATIDLGDDTLRALYTPGHRFDHLCFLLEQRRILFAGDLISGLGTNVIAPPDGDMQDYINSLRRMQRIDIAEVVPGHGPVITNPKTKLAQYIAHRIQREQQIISLLQELPFGTTIPELVDRIYTGIDPRLQRVAARSIEAHLLKLQREGRAKCDGEQWLLL